LGSRSPCGFIAGSDAGFEKWPEGWIQTRADRYNLTPDNLWIERIAKMIGELFADRVPF
jgi:hypothetical protein